jgi:hypothetical protein
MYIVTHAALGRGYRPYTGFGLGLGQSIAATFGPAAVAAGGPFQLTPEQLKVVVGAAKPGAPGQEAKFYIHMDSSGMESAYRFGGVRAVPAQATQKTSASGASTTIEIEPQAQFEVDVGNDEAASLSRKATRKSKGGAAVNYRLVGYGHTHPAPDSGEPSGTDLDMLASIPTADPMILMTLSRQSVRPAGARYGIDASVVWRSAYPPAPGGRLVQPTLRVLGRVVFPSHEDAARAARSASSQLSWRYFAGTITVKDKGQVESRFAEVR